MFWDLVLLNVRTPDELKVIFERCWGESTGERRLMETVRKYGWKEVVNIRWRF